MSTTTIVVSIGNSTVLSAPGVQTVLNQPVFQTVLNQALLIAGPPGPVGPPGGSVPTVAFAYGDASPTLITTLLVGQRLTDVRLSIEEAFNGVGARLSVGTMLDPDAYADGDLIDPASPFVFEFAPQTVFLVDTPVYLFITPGSGTSAGKGSVILQRQ